MESGKLRHLLTIQTATESRDAHGGISSSWATFAQVWGAVLPVSGREYMQADQVQGQVTHRVRIRRYPGVTPKMRVLHDARVLHIEFVRDLDERRAEMELLCREEV